MIARKQAPGPLDPAAAPLKEQADVSLEELSYLDLPREWRGELLDPAGWQKVLETFAGAMKLAVALTDAEGCLLGKCHNPQLAWRLARGTKPEAAGECPFCLAPAVSCNAVVEALRTGKVVTVEDRAGLSHIAVPLLLGGQRLGALIAGQVFTRYPEPLPLQRVARDLGIAPQLFWQKATQQVPVTRATLQVYANLLLSLGQAFLGQRYASMLQRKLAQTSQRYRLFIDGVPSYALLTVDPAGHVTSWNSGAQRLFGYTEAAILGQYASCLVPSDIVHREGLVQAMLEADRLGAVAWEGWRIRNDGTRFFGAGVLSSMRQTEPREYGILIHDVTEARRLEQDVQESQKLESIGVLASGIAHDFNNLLAGIIGSLSVLKTTLSTDDPSYSMLGIAQRSGARAAELVAQLLAYAGQGKFAITRFDFSALIADMLPLIAASIPKAVQLDLSLAQGLPPIEADASQIRQIVMNLVINGAEAIGAKGGTVRVSTGLLESGTDIFMEVKDSGSGMSETTQAKMFDPFFTTKFTGRGLGLAAVSGIVRSHKGTMRVESVTGEGTTFTVAFPAAQAVVLKIAEMPSAIVPSVTGLILVVDDEPALRTIAGVILESAGYSVIAAEDGKQAVEMFRQNAPSIAAVLLDMTMPVMGGLEALLLIREIQPGVPIVVSSGYSEVFAREGLADGIPAGFVQKPYTPATLVASLRQALQAPR